MGKRSDFERVPRDFYPTPYEAVVPLLPHLNLATKFVEPCAGNGALSFHLCSKGYTCIAASDIEPRSLGISQEDATVDILYEKGMDCFITNPPWSRNILHPLIENLSDQAPTWLLFDADWMHTKQAIPYLKWCKKIVSVGRVKWIPDSKMTGKDNCCWYLFDANHTGETAFYGRNP